MSVNLSSLGGAAAQFFDNNGEMLSGGRIYTYAAGTTTPQVTYTTNAGSIAHTNPIILDSTGRVPGGEIWLDDALSYKFTIEYPSGVLIATFDNIYGIANNSALTAYEALLASSAGSSYIGYLPGGTSAVATTVQNKLRQIVSVKDFGAVGDNATDDYGSIQAAINFLSLTGGGIVYVPPGNYRINNTLVINSNILLVGSGANVSAINVGTNDISVLTVSGGTFSGAKDIFFVGNLNASATASAVNIAQNIPALFRDCFIWGGLYALNNAGADGYYENIDFVGFATAGGNIISSGANWYVRCKVDQNQVANAVGFFQDAGVGTVKENNFVNCDFSGIFSFSIQINDSVLNSLMNFTNCVFSAPCLLQAAKWVAFNSCEFAGGASQFQIAGTVDVVSISDSYAFSPTPIPTGATRMLVTNNYNIESPSLVRSSFFTYDISTAPGTTTITDMTFKPQLVNFTSVLSPAASWGADDGITPRVSFVNANGAAGTYDVSGGASITLFTSAGNFVQGYISAFVSNGFTITWTKTGSPTGTATITYSALKNN